MNKKLLLKLAKHLESGKLGHDRFDFNTLHFTGLGKTCGLAIGELPFLFPNEWIFENGNPCFLKEIWNCRYPYYQAANFFGITNDESASLFASNVYYRDEYLKSRPLLPGMKKLPRNPTKEQVAFNIRAFVTHKETT